MRTKKTKISIIAPDLSQNSLSRPFLLANILKERYEVEIVGAASSDSIWPPLSKDKGIPIKPVFLKGLVSPYFKMKTILDMADGDILYASKPLLSSFGLGLLKKIKTGRKLGLDIDDWQIGIRLDSFNSFFLKGKVQHIVESLLYPYRTWSTANTLIFDKLVNKADFVTVSNSFLKKKFGGEIIWHVPDVKLFDPSLYEKRVAREFLGLSLEKQLILFSGTPREHKGIEDLICAVAELRKRDVLLLIVGMAEDKFCRRIRSYGEEQLGERIKFYEPQDIETIPYFLAASDVVAIPQKKVSSSIGQIPIKLFDAMSMGRPIVATDVSDISEILSGAGWVVSPGSKEELIASIGYILNNPLEAEEKGVKARQRFVERYGDRKAQEILFRIIDGTKIETPIWFSGERNKFPEISVVVPTHNDGKNITKCLESIFGQTYPIEKFEVIVIDNSSEDDTIKKIKSFPVRVYEERGKQSSYAARNLGVRNAKGDILAFIDADCIASSSWMEKGVEALRSKKGVGIVGGRVDIFFRNASKPNAVEVYDKMTHFKQEKYIKKHNFSGTGNLFVFKKAFEEVGLFKESLRSGGDREWGNRAYANGYNIVYEDLAIVAHPARYSLKEMRVKIKRVTKGCFDANFIKPSGMKYFPGLLRKIKNVMGDDEIPRVTTRIGVVFIMFYANFLRFKEISKMRFKSRLLASRNRNPHAQSKIMTPTKGKSRPFRGD
jgi:glycosyltransferase involved in cell wall biosynthesis